MKHAGADALDQLEPLLARLRDLAALKERTRGSFYFKSRGFLHFHEDPAGLFADLRTEDGLEFDRHRVDGEERRAAFLDLVSVRLARLAR
jgi:hypothetical protein